MAKKKFIEQINLQGISIRKAKEAILKMIWPNGAISKEVSSYDFDIYDSQETKRIFKSPDKDIDPALLKKMQKDSVSVGSMITLAMDDDELVVIFHDCANAEAKKIIFALIQLVPDAR